MEDDVYEACAVGTRSHEAPQPSFVLAFTLELKWSAYFVPGLCFEAWNVSWVVGMWGGGVPTLGCGASIASRPRAAIVAGVHVATEPPARRFIVLFRLMLLFFFKA